MTRVERNSRMIEIIRKIMWLPDKVIDKVIYGFYKLVNMFYKLPKEDLYILKECIYGVIFGFCAISLPMIVGIVSLARYIVG